jgi:uncharacterized protein
MIQKIQTKHIFIIVFTLLILGILILFPWYLINWGTISIQPSNSITIIGTAQNQQQNEMANYSAGVTVVADDKTKAINEVNTKINAITKAVQDFGIKSADLKTENLSINQEETTIYDNGQPKTVPGQWRISNTINIILRDVAQANDLTNLLSSSGATNVYGPNFSLNTANNDDIQLLSKALLNAQTKADSMAKSSNRKLGKVINITEGASQTGVIPMLQMATGKGGGGADLNTGSTTIEKSVTVTFELK